jgi:hypothetical protein
MFYNALCVSIKHVLEEVAEEMFDFIQGKLPFSFRYIAMKHTLKRHELVIARPLAGFDCCAGFIGSVILIVDASQQT